MSVLSCWWRHQWRCCGPVSVWRAAQNRQRVMFQLVGWSGTLSYTCPYPWLGDVWLWYDVSDLFSKTGVRMALTRYHRTSPIRDGLHIDTLAIGRPEGLVLPQMLLGSPAGRVAACGKVLCFSWQRWPVLCQSAAVEGH